MSLFLRWTFVFEHAIAVALNPIFSENIPHFEEKNYKSLADSFLCLLLTGLKLKNFKMRNNVMRYRIDISYLFM